MSKRFEFHQILLEIMGDYPNVYYQPPPSIQLKYPCIIYRNQRYRTTHASNFVYNITDLYEVMIITKDPDSILPREILKLPMVEHNRNFSADNLHHYVFNIHY